MTLELIAMGEKEIDSHSMSCHFGLHFTTAAALSYEASNRSAEGRAFS